MTVSMILGLFPFGRTAHDILTSSPYYMEFFSGKIMDRLSNPAIVALTDRNDVDDQLLGQEPRQAENRKDLKTLLKVASGGIVFFHHSKVRSDKGNIHKLLSERRNIVVITDEVYHTIRIQGPQSRVKYSAFHAPSTIDISK